MPSDVASVPFAHRVLHGDHGIGRRAAGDVHVATGSFGCGSVAHSRIRIRILDGLGDEVYADRAGGLT